MKYINNQLIIESGDFLAGGGGVTEAMSNIENVKVQWVLNHDPIAIRTNLFNHKNIKHYWADFYKQDEQLTFNKNTYGYKNSNRQN